MSQRVIIIGSNPMTRLSLIRSIGEVTDCDITVIGMVHEMPKKKTMPMDAHSKYVDRYLRALKYDADGLCNLLLDQFAGEGVKPLVLSVDDDSAYLIDCSFNKLKDHFHCAHVAHTQGQLARLMDKQVQKQLAEESGFHVAKSWVVEHSDGHYVLPEGITYPCYLKGLLSYHSMKAWQRRYDTSEALVHALDQVGRHCSEPMLVEEYIEVESELGVMGFADGRECVVPAIVELQESGRGAHHGVSVFGRVRKELPKEHITVKVTDMVNKIGLFGLFNVDLAVSHGNVFFVELNLRFAAYGHAITKAGVNLPALFTRCVFSVPETELSTTIQRECSYVNEYVALDDFLRGNRTLKECKALKRKADFGLMDDSIDDRPYKDIKRHLLCYFFKVRTKLFLDKLINKV
ncbi:MAG: ATP-grasp domain-containing protein [Prevotella sp.]|nr:ATP-grasp domain-containing protein [Prevotella sp.]